MEREGSSCVFIIVESLYSIDGIAFSLVQEHFPLQNAHIIVDDATGIHGKNGLGASSFLGIGGPNTSPDDCIRSERPWILEEVRQFSNIKYCILP